jgi:adenosylcobinamide-GDP ribazoletransferase
MPEEKTPGTDMEPFVTNIKEEVSSGLKNKFLKQEINILFTAIMFYTRIPVPTNTGFSDDMLNKSTRYFPFIGLVVGGIGAALFWGLHFVLPLGVAVILSMAGTIFITGAFHEDAFADFCDGFGSGYNRKRILEIMKDSRIGTFGAVAILLILLTKFICLSNMQASEIPLILISGHAFSRLLPVCMIYTSVYVRGDAMSKSKPIGHKGPAFSFWVAAFWGAFMLLFIPWKAASLIVAASVMVFVAFRWYAKRKIGGYTGDVLGALQQLAEITFYVVFLFYKQNLV